MLILSCITQSIYNSTPIQVMTNVNPQSQLSFIQFDEKLVLAYIENNTLKMYESYSTNGKFTDIDISIIKNNHKNSSIVSQQLIQVYQELILIYQVKNQNNISQIYYSVTQDNKFNFSVPQLLQNSNDHALLPGKGLFIGGHVFVVLDKSFVVSEDNLKTTRYQNLLNKFNTSFQQLSSIYNKVYYIFNQNDQQCLTVYQAGDDLTFSQHSQHSVVLDEFQTVEVNKSIVVVSSNYLRQLKISSKSNQMQVVAKQKFAEKATFSAITEIKEQNQGFLGTIYFDNKTLYLIKFNIEYIVQIDQMVWIIVATVFTCLIILTTNIIVIMAFFCKDKLCCCKNKQNQLKQQEEHVAEDDVQALYSKHADQLANQDKMHLDNEAAKLIQLHRNNDQINMEIE